MGDETGRGDSEKVNTLDQSVARPRARYRVLTEDKARAIASTLASDVSHTIESAAPMVGLNPSTVREALRRYEQDECTTDEDEFIAGIIYQAKADQMKAIRVKGFDSAAGGNNAGVAWMKWQLEVRDPKHHPRHTQQSVELSGPNGGPVESIDTKVRYVVHVPPDDTEDAPEPE